MHATRRTLLSAILLIAAALPLIAQKTQKPALNGRHWMAITGKPLAATAGSMIFQKGGNAVDAAAAMLAATCTMWDTLSWGGETQALIYDPHTKKVIALNALGVAPTGADLAFFRARGMKHPPEYGPLAAVTPGTVGGLTTMLAEYGTLSLKDVLGPAIELADGFPMNIELSNTIESNKALIKQWPYSAAVMLPHRRDDAAPATPAQNAGPAAPSLAPQDRPAAAPTARARREGPAPGEMFRQPELAATLRKLVEAEQEALRSGKSRKEAIYAAYERFYRGDVARELVRGTREQGGLFTLDDLAKWKVKIEEPVHATYKGIEVYKLAAWTQGPVMLQTLNILENFDLKGMGYNSARYIHTVYQAMNLAYADRDFYYGDPDFITSPILGLLSKDYARDRAKLVDPERNDPSIGPGDPYPWQRETNPYLKVLDTIATPKASLARPKASATISDAELDRAFYAGTTSVEAADAEGWVVSITPSGGWVPAVIAGHTGVGLSQRMQSFVTDVNEGPFNVVQPGKRPRVTLTPSMALKGGKPFLAFAVQGGDSQDQNLLQFFLGIVEFGMNVQEATEAPNFNSFQMRSSFGDHETRPGRILLNDVTPSYVRRDLKNMGYDLTFESRTSGPINAILFDFEHGTMWGGSSNHGDDYGISW
ncbi:MAG: Gamma-glutamyltranspeptidase [Acidobacteria bacterium]|nr:Gamma-glutamyltranspeptidase [Acidobacteriota bacterium]